jgi:hypothetical protein
VKPAFLLATAAAASLLLSSCCVKNGIPCKTVTLENRRDMYFPQKVEGPYTRMLCKGIPKVKKEKEIKVTSSKEVVPPGK